MNLFELLYLSLGNSSHNIFPFWSRYATRFVEKHNEWSTQSSPQSRGSFTEEEAKGAKLR